MPKSEKKLKKISGSCAPLALMYLSGLQENIVHEISVTHGWRQDWGMEDYEATKAAKDMGLKLRRLNLKKRELYGVKLREIIKAYNEGKYLVYTTNHLLVIHDGRVVDLINGKKYQGLDRIVTAVWKVLC